MRSYAAYRPESTPSVRNRPYSHLKENPHLRQLGKRSVAGGLHISAQRER